MNPRTTRLNYTKGVGTLRSAHALVAHVSDESARDTLAPQISKSPGVVALPRAAFLRLACLSPFALLFGGRESAPQVAPDLTKPRGFVYEDGFIYEGMPIEEKERLVAAWARAYAEAREQVAEYYRRRYSNG